MDKMSYKMGVFLRNIENKNRNCPLKLRGYLALTFQQAAQTQFDKSHKMHYPISNTQNLILIWTERTNNPIS